MMKYNKINMDAFYASRWKDSNLARGAFDARLAIAGGSGNEKDADSPAVDAGSKDFLNGGTTKTVKVSGNDQPDNNAPFELGGYDNYDPQNGNAIVAWESSSVTSGNNDDLDVGYHYGGAGYDSDGDFCIIPDDYETAVTLRHPKEAVNDDMDFSTTINGNSVDFKPEITSASGFAHQQSDIASSEYNGSDITIACFASDEIEDTSTNLNHRALLWRRFRGGDDACGVIGNEFTTAEGGDPKIVSVAMTTGKNSSGDMDKPIYAAAAACCGDWELVEPIKEKLEIRVYRYDPSPEGWTLVGEYIKNLDSEPDVIQDIALAADESQNEEDLIVFWTYDPKAGDNKKTTYGFRIDNAATLTSGNEVTITNPSNFVRNEDTGESIDAEWDGNISKPRLTWTEKNLNGKYATWSARVTFHPSTGHPNGTSNEYQILSDSSNDSVNPRICVSEADGVYNSTTDDIAESFVGVTCNDDAIRIDLQASSSSDNWQSPETYKSDITDKEMDVTYRIIGDPRHLFGCSSGDLYFDNKIIDNDNYMKAVKICTNKNNRRDVYTTYHIGSSSSAKLIIRQIIP